MTLFSGGGFWPEKWRFCFQVEDFDLGDDDFVEVYNGDDLEAPILARMSGKNRGGPQSIISTSNIVTVYFNSGRKDYE